MAEVQITTLPASADTLNPYSHSFTLTPHPPPPRPPLLNTAHPLTLCLRTYPFLASLATHLDHTDLDSLSRVCSAWHHTLRPYRRALLAHSLRCGRPRAATRTTLAPREQPCARDLVRACMRCREPMCRNCVVKPLTSETRLRRLCACCQGLAAARLLDRVPPRSLHASLPPESPWCECASAAWLCEPCSHSLLLEAEKYRERCEAAAEDAFTARLLTEISGNVAVVGGGEGGAGKRRRGVGCAMGAARCVGYEEEEREREGVEMGEEWELGEALEELGEVQLVGGKGQGLREGKEVSWGWGGTVDLHKEWSGEVRGWCRWCERPVMSKKDREELEGDGGLI